MRLLHQVPIAFHQLVVLMLLRAPEDDMVPLHPQPLEGLKAVVAVVHLEFAIGLALGNPIMGDQRRQISPGFDSFHQLSNVDFLLE